MKITGKKILYFILGLIAAFIVIFFISSKVSHNIFLSICELRGGTYKYEQLSVSQSRYFCDTNQDEDEKSTVNDFKIIRKGSMVAQLEPGSSIKEVIDRINEYGYNEAYRYTSESVRIYISESQMKNAEEIKTELLEIEGIQSIEILPGTTTQTNFPLQLE